MPAGEIWRVAQIVQMAGGGSKRSRRESSGDAKGRCWACRQ